MTDFPVVAAVDLGSNSFRLQIARVVANGSLLPLDSIKETVRLGAGLDEEKFLGTSAQERALEALSRFAERLQGLPPAAVRAVATHTFRVATNIADFTPRAEAALGFPIEIVGGQEEARLIFIGAAHSLPASRETRLVVDIGGGSTEFIVGNRFKPQRAESKQLGCVTWSQRFFADGKITADRMAEAELAARERLSPIVQEYNSGLWERAIGTSGTARALCDLLELNDFSSSGITAKGMARLRQVLIDSRHVDKVQLNGLRSDRRPVLAGGFAIMSAIFDMLRIEQMSVADGALREGVLHDLLERQTQKDIREHSVPQFQRRYHVDLVQAARVAQISATLFDLIEPGDEPDRMELARHLNMAAQLHEVGFSISHVSYRRHSAYILQHADIPGFSRREQDLMSRLVFAHRGRLNRAILDEFSRDERCALACLRLAVLFCRARQDDLPPILGFSRNGSAYSLELEPGWLESRPLTSHVLAEEMRLWKEIGISLAVVPDPLAARD